MRNPTSRPCRGWSPPAPQSTRRWLRPAAELGDRGRLVLRYSGTEPLVRIMIEGRDRDQIESLAAELAAVLAEELTP